MELYKSAKHLLTSKQLDESYKLLTKILDTFASDSSFLLSSGLTEEDLADVYNSRGHIKYLWVDFDGAIEDYTQAIRLNPSFAISYYNRGQIHYRMGKLLQLKV